MVKPLTQGQRSIGMTQHPNEAKNAYLRREKAKAKRTGKRIDLSCR